MKTGQRQLSFLIVLLLALSFGILCSAYFDVHFSIAFPYFLILLLLGGVASVILILKKSPTTWIVFVGLFFILGMFRFSAAYEIPASDISNNVGNDVKVTGIITDPPRITSDTDGSQRIRYTAEVKTIYAHGKEHVGSGRLFIYAHIQSMDELPSAHIGDQITAEGKIRRPHGYRNPGQIDTVFLLRSQGITATLHASQGVVSLTPTEKPSIFQKIMRFADTVRTHYIENMSKVMPHNDAAAIFAMLFGGYEGIRPELLEAFTTTGIIHILSVSGSHISLIAAATAWLVTILRLSPWVRAFSVITVIGAYVVLAGLVPPAVRSGIMGSVAFVGLVIGRDRDAQRILIITGLMMLLVSPLLFFHISFQLSFLSTAGLLFIAPILFRWMKGCSVFVAASLSITISAQLATFPVLAWYFNQISLSSLLSNLIVVPLVDIIIVFGLLGGIAAWLIPILGKLVFAFDSLLLGITFELTRWIALLPASKIWVPSVGIGTGLCYYAFLYIFSKRNERVPHFVYSHKEKNNRSLRLRTMYIFYFSICCPTGGDVRPLY